MKNNPSFWNWQGNELLWPSYSKWIAFGIVFLAFTLIFVFKKQIKSFHNSRINKKSLWIFKDGDEMLRWFGAFMLIYTFGKIGLYEANDYPFKWEHLMLHICRIHLIVMMVFLIIKKKELIKYANYISVMGAFFALWFGDVAWELNVAPDNITPLTLRGELLLDHDFTFYHQGWDNFFFYDFYFTHLFITIFPVYIWTANSWTIKTANLHRAQLVYFAGIILIWIFNYLSGFMPKEWWANNWYIGPDSHNDYNDALGWLSGWPQNLPSYLLIGVFASMMCHLLWIAQSNISIDVFKNIFKIEKNQNWVNFKKGYSKNILKEIFIIKKENMN